MRLREPAAHKHPGDSAERSARLQNGNENCISVRTMRRLWLLLGDSLVRFVERQAFGQLAPAHPCTRSMARCLISSPLVA